MASLSVVPMPVPRNLSLQAIEEHLVALEDSAALVPAEQEEQFRADLQEAMLTAADKRDQVGRFLAFGDSQVAFASAEIKRLQARKQRFEFMIERVEGYLIGILQNRKDAKTGKPLKLEGNSFTFSLARNPENIVIGDEEQIPGEYKSVNVKMPLGTWESILDELPLESRARLLTESGAPTISVDRSSVKHAVLKQHVGVAGADAAPETYRLVRR